MEARAVPTVGQLVRVRSRQHLVEDVVAPPKPGDDTLVRLSCLDDDARGEQTEVLWEHEVDAEVLTGASTMRVADRGFDKPDIFSAYLHTLRWNCVTATNPKLLQAPYRAGIEVMAYQLEPLRKALLLPRVNLFIADDVGLGKTIEAGLILRELLLRQKVRRVVVSAPPSVVLQWRDELEQRFGLTFVVFDRDYILRKRKERGLGSFPSPIGSEKPSRCGSVAASMSTGEPPRPTRPAMDRPPAGSSALIDPHCLVPLDARNAPTLHLVGTASC